MMNKRMLTAALLCSLFSIPAWAGAVAPAQTAVSQVAASAVVSTPISADHTAQTQAAYDLTFPAAKGSKESLPLDNRQVTYYAYRDLIYVAHPKNADFEKMNIFIPAAYLEGKSVNGYTAQTAPIFLPNQVGGYMPGKAGDPADKHVMGGGTSTLLQALDRGYVVASPAIRGRTTTNADGTYVGKAPALIVDYKSAVRYLRHNRKLLPAGDTEKIISDGTSAGALFLPCWEPQGTVRIMNRTSEKSGLHKNGTIFSLPSTTAPLQTCPMRIWPMNGSSTE